MEGALQQNVEAYRYTHGDPETSTE
jgi:hypothetical protein